MVGFADKFKSIVSQAQQKVADIQNSEQLKDIVGQIKKEYSEITPAKTEEDKQKNSEQLKAIVGHIKELAQITWEEHKTNSEKQKIESAAADASNYRYEKAVNTLKAIPTASNLYEEAQQKISEYVKASHEYLLQQAAQMVEQGLYNEAIKILKTIPVEAALYQQAQDKMSEYVNTFETLIKKHKNLTPLIFDDRIVAVAFVDQTVHAVKQIERRSIIYNSLASTYPDGEFLIIRLIVRNDGKKSRTISASMMTLIDSQEREYSVSNKGQTALQMNGDQTVECFVSEIQPGLQKIITIIFDVPRGVNNLSLKIPGGWGGETILPLSLAL